MLRVACVLVLGAAVAADWEADLKRFREAYTREAGTDARRAALLALGRSDAAPAAEVLLGVYEDLLAAATARRRELNETRARIRDLRKGLDDPRADEDRRQSIRRLVADLNDQDVRENAVLEGVELEQASALDALSAMRSEGAIDWMARTGLERAKDPLLLHTVALRVATSREAGVQTLVLALSRVTKPEHVVPLLQALGDRGADVGPGFATLLGYLRDRAPEVRVAAARAIGVLARPEGVEPLIRALEAEKGPSHAEQELARILDRLTGAGLGTDRALWARWWKDNREKVRSGAIELGKGRPEAGGKADQGHFYGIPQRYDRILYVVDISGSMRVSMEEPRWKHGIPIPARDDEESRFDVAKRELLSAIRNLHRKSSYAVLLYSDHATALHDALVEATPDNHAKVVNEMERREAEGSTNIYEALDVALRMANVHSELTRGDARADVIFLVSDGAPTNAKGQAEDPERTLQAVRQWNAMKRVAIHTIGVGAEHSESFMRTLAEENGGEYHAVLPRKK